MDETEPGGTCYEYIAVYVDDLAIAAKDPQAFCNELKKKYNLKLKGVGPLEYHLGCTYKKDPDGTLAADPRRYVNKILESYERMFKEKPRKSMPPLEGGDHPELDTSGLCDEHLTKQFQTLIGQLQWLISLGRFDIAVHVMSLSRFRAQPRKGHFDRAKTIVGYLLFLPDGAIRFRTGEPDFSSLKDQAYDWTRSVYSGACEWIPHDIPKALGKHGQTTHYVNPGAEPPRDARDSGSARSHSTHLETSSSDRPKMETYTEPQTVPSYMSVTCTRRMLRMPNFTHATHAQPSLSNFPKWDSNFGEPTHSRGTTLWEQSFPTSPQNKITKLTHCLIYTSIRTISSPRTK